jgi:hypothetical protein
VNDLDKAPLGLGEVARSLLGPAEALSHRLLEWAASLSPTAAAFVAVLALVSAVVGARRPMVRVVAAAVGYLLGLAYAARFQPWLEFAHLPSRDLTIGLGAAFALFGTLLPEGITFAIGGLFCGTVIATFFPSDDRTYAFVPAFLVGGAAGVMMFPLVAAVVASFGGGLLCAAAIAVLLPRATLGGTLTSHPLLTAGLGLLIGLAGLIGQLRAPYEDGTYAEDEAPKPSGGSQARAQKPKRACRKKAKAKASAEP